MPTLREIRAARGRCRRKFLTYYPGGSADEDYGSRPSWETYSGPLAFAAQVREDVEDIGPRDMIDIRSYIWVLGSDEYPD
jgi:hypothetical protein